MKSAIILATVLAVATPTAQAYARNHGRACIARVLYSKELPYAPIHDWLVQATLEITPPDRGAYVIVVQDTLPWQAPPPRRGQTFRLRCDPDYPADLHLVR